MTFKLVQSDSQQRWRSLSGPHLAALFGAGAKFDKGVLIEQPNEQEQEAAGYPAGIRSTGL